MSPGRDKAVWELAAMNRAKIVKAERKRELAHSFPRRILSYTKIMKKRYKFAFLYVFL